MLLVRETQSMEDALQVAVRELGRALQAPRTQVVIKLAERDLPDSGDGI